METSLGKICEIGRPILQASSTWAVVEDSMLSVFSYLRVRSLSSLCNTDRRRASIFELGYKTTHAQLLTVPLFVAAPILTVIVGFIGDRTRQRGVCAMLVSPLAVVGFAMLLGSRSANIKMAASFLAALGIYPCIPNTTTRVANNTEDIYKRGATLTIAMGWANL